MLLAPTSSSSSQGSIDFRDGVVVKYPYIYKKGKKWNFDL